MDKIISMAHGDGGELSHQLIKDVFIDSFNSNSEAVFDAATLPWTGSDIVVSTDSFVVKPIFFPGGNIGKLAVTGTVNDLAVSGAKPLYLTCGFVIEEGFPISDLKIIVQSMKEESDKIGVRIIAGDTKVVEKGSADGIYINTTGIGTHIHKNPDPHQIQEGDVVLLNGTIGDHGIAILAARNELGLMTDIKSDCTVLADMIDQLLLNVPSIRIMRDPTRGGLATSLVEIAEDFACTILLKESMLPIKNEIHGACDIMGFDPLYLANEGKVIVIVAKEDEEKALSIMKQFEYGKDAVTIGTVSGKDKGKLLLETPLGAKRRLTRLAGVMLPRIC